MFDQSNHTPVSNEFIDGSLPSLNGSAVKVFVVISRNVIGWGGEVKKTLSFTDIIKLTGLSKNIVSDAIKTLRKRNVITMETVGKGRGTTHSFSVNYVPKSGTIPNNVPKTGTIINRGGAKRSAESSQKLTHFATKPVSPTGNMSRSRARSTSQDSIGLVSEILKEEMFIQHLPPEGGRFHKRLIELFETRGASWFRSYAKWYKERKMKRLGWSPSLFVSASMVEEFDVMKRINSVTTSSRAMKGVQSEAFLKKSREFQASVLKRK